MTAAPAAAALALRDAMPGYLVEGKIGEGTFGEVFLIRHTRRRTAVFALKRSKPGRDGDFGGLTPSAVREAALLSALRHANIVRLEKAHVNHDDGSLSLVFDFAEYDLHDIITHHARLGDGPPPPFLVKSVVWQMLQGVAFLHSHRLVHRDLKPSNILLMGPDSREPGCVKIADFGLARSLRAPLRPLADNGVVVTIWYRAPELLLGARHYDEAIDTWAAGAILGECLSGRALFKGVEAKGPGNPFQLDQLRRIFAALGPPREADWPELAYLPYWIQNREEVRELQPQDATSGFEDRGGHLPAPGSAARDLLLRLVAYAPAARLMPAAALRHPWFEEAPPPSANALLGPAGERAGPYPRRVPESAARAKRKADEAPPPQQQPHQLPAPPRGAPTRRDSQPARQLPHASAYQWD